MDQIKIWDRFQNDESFGDAFSDAAPRYSFLAKQTKPGMAVLNIGVGRGGLEALLVQRGVTVYCLDPSQESIARIRVQHAMGDRAQVGLSQHIPFPDQQFDVVIMSEVLEHLTDEVLTASLAEVRRLLKPEGHFIGTVPANERLSDNRAVCPHCGEAFHRWGHIQSFSTSRLLRLLSDGQFTVRRMESRVFPSWDRGGLRNLLKSTARYVLGRIGSPIAGPSLFFKATR